MPVNWALTDGWQSQRQDFSDTWVTLDYSVCMGWTAPRPQSFMLIRGTIPIPILIPITRTGTQDNWLRGSSCSNTPSVLRFDCSSVVCWLPYWFDVYRASCVWHVGFFDKLSSSVMSQLTPHHCRINHLIYSSSLSSSPNTASQGPGTTRLRDLGADSENSALEGNAGLYFSN